MVKVYLFFILLKHFNLLKKHFLFSTKEQWDYTKIKFLIFFFKNLLRHVFRQKKCKTTLFVQKNYIQLLLNCLLFYESSCITRTILPFFGLTNNEPSFSSESFKLKPFTQFSFAILLKSLSNR